MATSKSKNIEIYQKNDKSYLINYKTDVSGTMQPVDVSNMIFTLIVKNENDSFTNDSQAIIKKVVTCPANSDSEDGKIFLNLSVDDTNVKSGTYKYQFQIKSADSVHVATLVEATFTVKENRIKE